MDTVTLTIDGAQVTVQKGKTVLEAAIEHGYEVPYYCYHPALGVDGSCRVCIVKIEKMPKLQTACSTGCADGMVVYTQTPDVIEARAGVFEFLLLNHPLDCPVCDKGGECPLQDFSYSFGPAHSRMEFERRVFDGEGVRADVDFGPTLMLNRNRCILCTRCVRFMQQIDGDAQIGIVDRGNGSEIATFQEQGVHSLLSGNLADVCPVGAITTRQYRFKSRPWDNPRAVDTICTLCAKGCNTMVWVRAKPEWAKAPQLVRITPRLNPDVNGYWMCDIGRFDYQWVEGENRLTRPMIKGSDGLLTPVTWDELWSTLQRLLTRERRTSLRWLLSAHASVEELYLFKRLAADLGTSPADSITVTWRVSEKSQPAAVKFRVSRVDAPNVNGARDLGLARADDSPDLSALADAVRRGEVEAVYVFSPGPPDSLGDTSWLIDARRAGKLSLLVYHGTTATELTAAADVVIAGATYLEKDAIYSNDQGRVQVGAQVVRPPGQALEDWICLTGLARSLELDWKSTSLSDVRAEVTTALTSRPGYASIASLPVGKPVPVRHWLEASNPSERYKWDRFFCDLPPVKFEGKTVLRIVEQESEA